MGGRVAPARVVEWHDARVPERVYTAPLLDKLGVKPGSRVAVIALEEPWFLELLADRTDDVTLGPPEPETDLVFLGAASLDDLAPLAALRPRIRPNGGIWVVSRKGRAATIRDTEVMSAAATAGLVDNKVVSFSDTQTSIRLVIRLRDRAGNTTRG
jgi:hypothetical protein